ncbi:hypothetical protein AWC38_SpisGene23089 [Stylophora pistillata]|uniref:Uncharacterized protein n=1 Tax=Stylophora pistillata TaxID=50429 RepID=A0A2B4R9C5_STYPI|nr:hypothetical protein AWC38_SpisGene23089 [Stylophora pistillata]
MAERRLELVEKKFMKDAQFASAYQGVLDEYLKKGYVRVVTPSEPQPDSEWFLRHFPVKIYHYIDSYGETLTYEAPHKLTSFHGLYSEDATALSVLSSHGRHTLRNRSKYPLAAEAVQRNGYMDDLMPSLPTIEIAKETRNQLTELGKLNTLYCGPSAPTINAHE